MRIRNTRLWRVLALCLGVGACAAPGPGPAPDGYNGHNGGGFRDGTFFHTRGDDYPGPALTGGYSGGS